MDKLAKYRVLIKQLLTNYQELINRSSVPKEVETEIVFDEVHDQYMLLNIGWFQDERMRGITLYLRLRNDKIWIEEDWLEEGIVKDLLAAGVPKEDIVLAFQHPQMRPYTEFAVA
jgi:hypothetical protein